VRVENFVFLPLHGGDFTMSATPVWVYAMLHDAFPFDLAEAKKEGRLMGNSTLLLLKVFLLPCSALSRPKQDLNMPLPLP